MDTRNGQLPYYPIVVIDAIHVKVRRETVASEAFYVVLGVTPEGRREVLAISPADQERYGLRDDPVRAASLRSGEDRVHRR